MDGPHAGSDVHCCFVETATTAGIEEIRTPLLLVTPSTAHHPELSIHRRARDTAENLLGEEGGGMAFSHAWFRRERLMIAARCCGAAARLIEEGDGLGERADEWMASRSFGASNWSMKFMLADSVTELWAARLMTYETALAHDRGDDVKVACTPVARVAKLYASEAAEPHRGPGAVQIFGGRGYMRENPAERFFRELRVDRIWEGTSEIQRLIIARGLLKRGLDAM